ncbi:hypothetical protein BDV25DRAFT_135213 [Aspergillus avenaceus]|uniref:Uncharacterized protein n=1 Tax=Aspergillus avenaceus TaxID=36643 RepID=A0A5N6U965_ASPAV|nr:hypothetical protein BDV25DRAFT_135213 [Aspergillus avenaceus]
MFLWPCLVDGVDRIGHPVNRAFIGRFAHLHVGINIHPPLWSPAFLGVHFLGNLAPIVTIVLKLETRHAFNTWNHYPRHGDQLDLKFRAYEVPRVVDIWSAVVVRGTTRASVFIVTRVGTQA